MTTKPEWAHSVGLGAAWFAKDEIPAEVSPDLSWCHGALAVPVEDAVRVGDLEILLENDDADLVICDVRVQAHLLARILREMPISGAVGLARVTMVFERPSIYAGPHQALVLRTDTHMAVIAPHMPPPGSRL